MNGRLRELATTEDAEEHRGNNLGKTSVSSVSSVVASFS
jgi:hypothetical protein